MKLTKYFIKAWWNGIKFLWVKRKQEIYWACGEVYFTSKENRDGYEKEMNELALKWLGQEPVTPKLK